MNIVSLQRRLFSTIIDKFFILFLFVIVAFVFRSGYPGSELGTFAATATTKYSKIESERTLYQAHLNSREYIEDNNLGEYNFIDEEYEHYKTALDVYQKHVLIFVIVNLLYYLICEIIFKASMGKKLLKCQIRKKDGECIGYSDVITRVGILFSLLISGVAIQIILNLNAYITSVLFFGILDYTVFTRQQSLVDKYSDTYVVKIS